MGKPMAWQKSSFSESEGSCVELAWHGESVVMRESDDPGVVIRITPAALGPLIASVKSCACFT
ncbi:DUF397 domain-containing protein [Streptomyces sp. URMC 124]|uniref:DUF397 domain-containing protein n=1 Tax=Streptomyces sp. URMC 124 TaxID=3423405 RepID=UPI003F1D4F46